MNKRSRPILYINCGPSGSGKTYFGRRFAREHGLAYLSSDRLRQEIYGGQVGDIPEAHKHIFKIMWYLAEELLGNGVSVVFDSMSHLEEYRKTLRDIARKAGARAVVLYFKTPLDTALTRVTKRHRFKAKHLEPYFHKTPEHIVRQFYREFEEPRAYETSATITSDMSYKEGVETIAILLKKRGIKTARFVCPLP